MSDYEDLLTEFAPVIDSVAHGCANKASRWGADEQDFAQEFRLWMWTQQKQVERQRADLGDDKAFTAWLARCLWNEGHDYALDMRAQAGGQDRPSAYFYNKGDLELLLEAMFDEEQWLHPPQHDGEGGRSNRDPSEGGNWVTTLADVSRGFERLDGEDQDLLSGFHEDGLSNIEMARLYYVAESTMSERHERALGRLLQALGGPAPRPMKRSTSDPVWRGRHAITNAKARVLTSANYE